MTSEHPCHRRATEEWESPDEARLLVKATQTGEGGKGENLVWTKHSSSLARIILCVGK